MRKLYSALILLLAVNITNAQNVSQPATPFSKQEKTKPGFFQSPVNNRSAYQEMVDREMASFRVMSQTQENLISTLEYDVNYYRLNLRINPDTAAGKYIRGNITTYFTTLQASLSVIKFDFASELICDSVYYHGVKVLAGNKVEDIDTLEITVAPIVTAGTLDSVTVYYRGVPRIPGGFANIGYMQSIHNTNKNYVFTLSEPYSAFTWWPCKSRVTSDKADSVDIIVSTPTAFKVAANGIVASETTDGTNRTTFWKHRYPISSYQVCVAVANYVQYPTTPTMVNINGTMMPFFNYLFPETDLAAGRTALDRTPLMLTTFSAKYGDYPFKNEKYGHYTFGFSGGMEHNSFSGMGTGTYNSADDWSVISHELAHQWWGAGVTCGSWRDIWVNESFARYSEVVSAEFAPTTAPLTTAILHRAAIKTSAINPTNQAKSIYQNDTTSISTIFSPSVYIYERGAMVISMLRMMLGDAKFFQALQNYQADPTLKYKNAFTDDVKRHMEAVSGLDLSIFFSQWIYNRGFAEYNAAKWNNNLKNIVISLPQSNPAPAIAHFDMPVVVRILGATPATQDTTVIIYDQTGILYKVNNGVFTSTGASLVQYNLSFTPTRVVFDSLSQVFANGAFAKDPALTLLAANNFVFSAQKDGRDVKLVWSVEAATSFKSFEVEKSADGITFNKIATFTSNDYPNRFDFNTIDYAIGYGKFYYRVKLVEANGAAEFSKTIVVANNTASGLFTVTPNPAKDFIVLKYTGTLQAKINIKIFDASARLVKKINQQLVSLNNQPVISIKNLTAGSYYVEIEGLNNEKITQKIVVIK